jgi:HEAT repeat protein
MRIDAMKTLTELDPKVVVPVLLEVLRETKDARVRSDTVTMLGRIGPVDGVVPALIDVLLNDEDRRVGGCAAFVLGRYIGPEEGVIPALIQAMEEDPRMRWSVTEGLVAMGPEAEEAVPALIQAALDGCSSEDEMACRVERNAIFRALQAITGQDFGDDASAWQEWWETHGR